MKKSTIWKSLFTAAITLIAGNVMFAQEIAGPPAGFIQHPSSGTESIDSLTIGSAVQYWAQPDAAFTGTGSTFNWSISGLGTIGATTTNLATVTYGSSVGTGTLDVIETSPAPSCAGSTTTINFAVINAPTAAFGADPTAQCASASNLTFNVPITVTTDINGSGTAATVRVRYTLYNPTGGIISGPTDIELLEGAERNFNVTIPGGSAAGTYYVLISSITDRISRKPTTPIEGTSSDNRINLVVNPVPVTGPIYHLPNM